MPQKVFIKNKKELKLAVIVSKPENEGVFPAVILLHGFTGYKEEPYYPTLSTNLLKHDIVSIRFDASGYGESEGTLEKDYRFSNYLSDIGVIYKYTKSLDYVDESRIAISGHSMGGLLTIVFSSRHPAIICLCAISSPVKMETSKEMSKNLLNWKKRGYLKKVSSRFGPVRIPWAFIEDASKWDATSSVKRVKVPILVIAGTGDTTVLSKETKKIYESANQPKEYIEIKGMTHDFKNYPEILSRVNNKITDFFIKYLNV